MDERTRKWFSAYVAGLRDIADCDYIMARTSTRLGLYQSAAWCGLQALEKYLKAILLYSYRPVCQYRSHHLQELAAAVDQLPHLNFGLPQACLQFLKDLETQGNNRYSDVPIHVEGAELFELDRLVWHTRRYCQDFLLLPGDDQRYPGESTKRLATVPGDRTSATLGAFALPRGYLETILRDSRHRLRPNLVWKNRYFGLKKKGAIQYRYTVVLAQPPHVMRPDILLPVLEPLVFFPRIVLETLRKLKAEHEKTTTV